MIDKLNHPDHEIPTIRIRQLHAASASKVESPLLTISFDCDAKGVEQINLDIEGNVFRVIRDIPRTVVYFHRER